MNDTPEPIGEPLSADAAETAALLAQTLPRQALGHLLRRMQSQPLIPITTSSITLQQIEERIGADVIERVVQEAVRTVAASAHEDVFAACQSAFADDENPLLSHVEAAFEAIHNPSGPQ